MSASLPLRKSQPTSAATSRATNATTRMAMSAHSTPRPPWRSGNVLAHARIASPNPTSISIVAAYGYPASGRVANTLASGDGSDQLRGGRAGGDDAQRPARRGRRRSDDRAGPAAPPAGAAAAGSRRCSCPGTASGSASCSCRRAWTAGGTGVRRDDVHRRGLDDGRRVGDLDRLAAAAAARGFGATGSGAATTCAVTTGSGAGVCVHLRRRRRPSSSRATRGFDASSAGRARRSTGFGAGAAVTRTTGSASGAGAGLAGRRLGEVGGHEREQHNQRGGGAGQHAPAAPSGSSRR